MEDWQIRLCNEYFELNTRIMSLQRVLYHYKNGTLPFNPVGGIELMSKQLKTMKAYRDCLEERAALADIPL
jgi:hypothetical protein